MRGALLIPNIGAEEELHHPADGAPLLKNIGATAELWRTLFSRHARFVGEEDSDSNTRWRWPAVLGSRPADPIFDWLDTEGEGDAFAWLNTRASAREAEKAGRKLSGAPPEVVREVHDKAFAHAAATAERLLPASLEPLITVLDPDTLRDETEVIRIIEERVADWPDWTGGRFTLKPRLGTSGRGRVAGVGGRASEGRGAFSRLAEAGGAMLEPWLHRTVDLSVQLWLGAGGELVLLGTTELLVDPSGLYRGHRGYVDSRGRVTSGSRHDEALREAAVCIAQKAATAGYCGPCGIDAFAFGAASGCIELRPVVEFNARFTLGTIAIGMVRRALPVLRREMGLEPGERRAFHFGLREPSGGWPEAGVATECLVAPFGEPAGGASPALVVVRDGEALSDRLSER